LLWIGNKQALENFGKGLGILNDPIYQANMNAVTDLMNMDSFKLQSPLLPFNRGGAIATASVSGYTPTELANTLMNKFGIFTVGIDHPVIRGVRVTPHLSSSVSDCIALNKAFTAICVDLIPHLEPIK
jgi:selenocysteine lyase/cysteine desulfurase